MKGVLVMVARPNVFERFRSLRIFARKYDDVDGLGRICEVQLGIV